MFILKWYTVKKNKDIKKNKQTFTKWDLAPPINPKKKKTFPKLFEGFINR